MTAERWQQAKAIFHAAVECDPAVRAALLQERCGGDEELRREVESLLDSEKDPRSFLMTGAMGAGMMAPASERQTLHTPFLFGDRYEVERELGRGGMSVVYLARDRQLLGKRVVVKVLLETASLDSWIRQKFLQEMEALSRIDHPGVVGVLDTGLTAEGKQFLVMQYIDGATLRSVIEPGGMESTRAAGILRQIGQALAAAHEKGVWHRDLKPENIMLQRLGSEDHVKLIDFGIAGIQDSQFKGEKTKVAGSVSYMAPEQYSGNPCAASDTYALGVVAYEILAGTLPGKTISSQPQLAEGAERSIRKAMSLRPDDRQSSVREFSDELYQVLSDGKTARGLATSSASPTVELAARTAKAKLTRPTTLLAAFVLLALLAAGSAFWSRVPSLSGPDQQSIAVLPFTDLSPAKDQGYFSDGIAEEIQDALTRLPKLRVIARLPSAKFRDSKDTPDAIGKKLNVATLLTGSVRIQGGRARITTELVNTADGSRLWSNKFDRDLSDVFAVQEEIARTVIGALKITMGTRTAPVLKTTNPEAHNAYLQGRHLLWLSDKKSVEAAMGYFQKAIQLDPGFAPSWLGLGECHSNLITRGYLLEATGVPLVRSEVERALILDPALAEAHTAMGRIKMLHDWDWLGAQSYFRRASELAPGKSNQQSTLALVLGHNDEAVELSQRDTAADPLSPGAFHNAGLAFYRAKGYDKAVEAYKKALELSPGKEVTHSGLTEVYLAQGRLQEALEEAQAEKNPALSVWAQALAFHALARKDEADLAQKTLIGKYGEEASMLIAELCAYRGQKEEAFQWLEKAYSVRDSGLTLIKNDPLLRNLETDPRFRQMLQRMHLS